MTEGRSAEGSTPGEVYRELKPVARRLMRGERSNHTLQPTALLHEAYCRMAQGATRLGSSMTRFRLGARQYMERILIDYARARRREKRGGAGLKQVPLLHAEDEMLTPDQSVERMHDRETVRRALDRLATTVRNGARERQVLELHFRDGYTFAEIARQLGLCERQVRRDWQHARIWLQRELGSSFERDP